MAAGGSDGLRLKGGVRPFLKGATFLNLLYSGVVSARNKYNGKLVV